MCGIAGIILNSKHDSLKLMAKSMATSLSHRGPDDSDVWIHQDQLALVHTRLAIQDLSANGKQPMASESQRYMIAYNGEVYNFKKIAQELEQLGKKFTGHSDTEVILSAIETYGLESALEKFEGMFAFSLFDKKENTLHLCRDRLGEKPLFYCWNGNSFLWASELKALTQLDNWQGKINKPIIPQYLQYGYVPAPNTIYENCYKLVPGTILSFSIDETFKRESFSPFSDNDSVKYKPHKFWDVTQLITPDNRNNNISYEDAVEELDTILGEVITDQMISDVPYGAFLSGGIDSSLVASVMQSLSNKPINTFTIGFNEKDFNEAGFAKEISNHIGSNHHELYISSQDCLNLVPNITSMMDEPFADSSVLPAYFVSKMARDKVTVCLSGDGGDELFCGYNRYTYTQSIWKKVNHFPLGLRVIAAKIINLFPPNFYENVYQLLATIARKNAKNTRIGLKIQKLAELLKMKNINEIYQMLISYCHDSKNIFKGQYQHPLLLESSTISSLNSDEHFIERAMAMDTITYLPDDNLTKVDRTSMASSLETRLPLLNHKVIEFAWTLPLSMKYDKNISKRILRDVLFKRVPRELIERPKMGFSVPIADWLRGPLKSWGESLIFDQENHKHDLLNQQSVNNLWKQHMSASRDNSAALWSILMLQSWVKETNI